MALSVNKRYSLVHKNQNTLPLSCTVCHVTTATEIEKSNRRASKS